MELVSTETEVQCEITNLSSVPTCSKPMGSPVKSVEGHSDDNQKDLGYIPKYLIPAGGIFNSCMVEEEVDERGKKTKQL